MDIDDEYDGPPMLVDVNGHIDPAEATLNAEMKDVNITKVPITIITGRQFIFSFLMFVENGNPSVWNLSH